MAETSLTDARRRQQKKAPIRFDINNETAAELVQQLATSLDAAMDNLATLMQTQVAMLQQVLQSQNSNDDVLDAIRDQNELLIKMLKRPIEVAAGNVEVAAGPRPTRFEFETDPRTGNPVALVVTEET